MITNSTESMTAQKNETDKSKFLEKLEKEELEKHMEIIAVTKSGKKINFLVKKGKTIPIDEVITSQLNYEKGIKDTLDHVRQEIKERIAVLEKEWKSFVTIDTKEFIGERIQIRIKIEELKSLLKILR